MQEQSQFEPFVDANAVAGHLKVTRRQVLEMTRQGVIPGHPLGTGSSRSVWRYKLSEIDDAVSSAGRVPLKIRLARTPGQVQSNRAVPA